MSDTNELDFLVRRDDLATIRWDAAATRADAPLDDGEVMLAVERYSFTANNVTYARLGDMLNYWAFFRAPEGWGRIPVWGFARAVASRAAGVNEGDRFFGFLPMSPYVRVRAEGANPMGFVDASEHRRPLPSVYQHYARVRSADPAEEDLQAVLRPVFGTGFLIDDWLAEQADFGAEQVVFASASSKTALATAFSLSRRANRACASVGLTSPRNRAFCERVGYYDRVAEYASVATLPVVPTVFVDMAGDWALTEAVHTHFGEALRHSSRVGLTHHEGLRAAPPSGLPGPAPTFFFAPTQIEARRAAWGPEGFAKRLGAAQRAFFDSARGWLTVVHKHGPEAIEAAYRAALSGGIEPSQGLVLSLSAEGTR